MVNTLNSENINLVKIYHFLKKQKHKGKYFSIIHENIKLSHLQIRLQLTFHKIGNYLVLLSKERFSNAFKRLMYWRNIS